MATPDQPLPASSLSREQIAQMEVGHTAVAPATVGFLLAFFLTALIVVPIGEWIGARAFDAQGESTPWAHLAGIPSQARSGLAELDATGLWSRIVVANRAVLEGLSGFERALENESWLGQTLRPPAQVLMTRWLGAGNERVYPGHDPWLFYRPDVEFVTGPGFLEPSQFRRRVAAAPEWTTPPQPDPRTAIRQLKRDLDARGISLIVMPTPVKPQVHPEQLSRRYVGLSGVLHNPSFPAFIDELRRDGVLVFDPADALARARTNGPQYLATDTHWRPEAMEDVTELLGAFILTAARLPAAPDPGYRVERSEVQNTGDAARMLDLPEARPLFARETVWLRRILQPDGSAWRSSRDADVLLLGDSFTNIYALESLGWGTSAGLAEQLSYVLRRPVDRLGQNDDGAFATRGMLARDPARLNGKRVVIYQFAARELAFGDWKILPLP